MNHPTHPIPPADINHPHYIRVPGVGGFVISYVRLYLGQDHLLQVLSSGFTEDYQRFFLKDIEAVVVRKSFVGKILNAILIPVLALCVLGILFSGGIWEVIMAWSIPTAILAILTLFHLLSGPTCVTHLQTATGQTQFRSLNRIRKARAFLKLIQPLVEQAQNKPAPTTLAKEASDSPSPTTEPSAPEQSQV